MYKYLALLLLAFQISCCGFAPLPAETECVQAKIFIGRLEKEIVFLQNRPAYHSADLFVDRNLIKVLREASLDMQSKLLAFCSE